jgi:hypothetical protein
MKKETRNLAIFFLATFIWTWAIYTPSLPPDQPENQIGRIKKCYGCTNRENKSVGISFRAVDI